jgi:hypothetical protein
MEFSTYIILKLQLCKFSETLSYALLFLVLHPPFHLQTWILKPRAEIVLLNDVSPNQWEAGVGRKEV